MANRLPIEQPFALAVTLEMGQAFRWRRVGDEHGRDRDWGDPPERWRSGGGWYSGVLGPHLVHIRQVPGGVEYRVGGDDGEREDIDLGQRLRDYFRLDDDIDAIYAELSHEPAVARAIERHRGLRLLRQDPWECLVSYMCSQTRSIRGTRGSVGAIAELSRRTVRLGGDVRCVFPTARMVADPECGMTGLKLGLGKARNIFAIARELDCDPLALDRMADPSAALPDAVRLLDRYPGVGPKIAGCVALMSLNRLDAFPVDRWVQRALRECDLSAMPRGSSRLGLPEKISRSGTMTPAQQYVVAAWAREHFGRYAGYAGQYLFHDVETHKERARRAGGCPICGGNGSATP